MAFANTKLGWTKFVVGKVASYGTGVIAAAVITNNVMPGNLTLPKKIAVGVAGALIASMIQAAVVEHADKLIDDVVDGYLKYMSEQKKEA